MRPQRPRRRGTQRQNKWQAIGKSRLSGTSKDRGRLKTRTMETTTKAMEERVAVLAAMVIIEQVASDYKDNTMQAAVSYLKQIIT